MDTSIRPTARDAIMEAGFRLLSADPSASLAQIAERAGVGRATLHRHFAGREELLRELALRAYAEMDAAADTAARSAANHADALRAILDALIPLGDRHGFLAHFGFDHDETLAEEIARQSRETHEMIEAARLEGLFDASIPTGWIERLIDAAIMMGWESIRAGETTPRQASALAWTSLIRGVGANA